MPKVMHGVESPARPGAATGLHIEFCSRSDASLAAKRWHYIGKISAITVAQFGVWEDGRFIGSIVFGAGPRLLARRYRCKPREACELTRVALAAHRTPVSRILAITVRLLRQRRPDLRLIVSFADTDQGHHGGIYQASGWIYTGVGASHVFRINGKNVHPRTCAAHFGSQSVGWLRRNVDWHAKRVVCGGKHRYLMPLDEPMARRIRALAKPYPKRAK